MILFFRLADRLATDQRPARAVKLAAVRLAAARLAAAGLAWIVLPYVWQQTLGRWLQYGLAAGAKWPAAMLALWLVLAALGYVLRRETAARSDERVGVAADNFPCRRAMALAACWCLAQAALWRAWSSPLSVSPGAGLLFVLSTLWLFWTWAIVAGTLRVPSPVAGTLRVPSPNLPCDATPRPRMAHGACQLLGARLRRVIAMGGSLLATGAAISCLQANGLDGAGRVVISYRAAPSAERARPSLHCFRSRDAIRQAFPAFAARAAWASRPIATCSPIGRPFRRKLSGARPWGSAGAASRSTPARHSARANSAAKNSSFATTWPRAASNGRTPIARTSPAPRPATVLEPRPL